mgnify:CR=1 FL=1
MGVCHAPPTEAALASSFLQITAVASDLRNADQKEAKKPSFEGVWPHTPRVSGALGVWSVPLDSVLTDLYDDVARFDQER